MRGRKKFEDETNPRAYRLHRKERLVSCTYCPYHGGENATRDQSHRSWKNYRSRQYKDVPVE